MFQAKKLLLSQIFFFIKKNSFHRAYYKSCQLLQFFLTTACISSYTRRLPHVNGSRSRQKFVKEYSAYEWMDVRKNKRRIGIQECQVFVLTKKVFVWRDDSSIMLVSILKNSNIFFKNHQPHCSGRRWIITNRCEID